MRRIGAILAAAATSIAAQAQTNYMPIDIPTVSGLVHLQDYGDRPLTNGQWAGTTTGESRRLEGLALRLSDTHGALRLEYHCRPVAIADAAPTRQTALPGHPR